jgi:hypothetical protein
MIKSFCKNNAQKGCVLWQRLNSFFVSKHKVKKKDSRDEDLSIPFSNVILDTQLLGSGILKVNEKIFPPSSLKLQRTEFQNKLKLYWKSGLLSNSFLVQMNTSHPEVEASWMTCGVSNQNEFEIQLNDVNKNLWFRVSTIQGNERSQWSVGLMYSTGKMTH